MPWEWASTSTYGGEGTSAELVAVVLQYDAIQVSMLRWLQSYSLAVLM